MPEATFSVSEPDLTDEILPPYVSSSVTVEGRSGWGVDDRERCDLLEGLGWWFRGSEFRPLLFDNLSVGFGMSYLTNFEVLLFPLEEIDCAPCHLFHEEMNEDYGWCFNPK